MKKSEALQLLTIASSVDNRNVTDLMVAAWFDILEPLDYDDCVVALREFRRNNSGVYLEPGHLWKAVAEKSRAATSTDRGIARPPAPLGKRYAVDAIEELEA